MLSLSSPLWLILRPCCDCFVVVVTIVECCFCFVVVTVVEGSSVVTDVVCTVAVGADAVVELCLVVVIVNYC